MGIAPAPKPVGDPSAAPLKPPLTTGVQTKFPINPAAASPSAVASPAPGQPFNPAARDLALRNLATQTPAAPTAVPAAPTPASTDMAAPAVQTKFPTNPGAPPAAPPGSTPAAGGMFQQFIGAHPEVQSFVDAIHSAATPQARSDAIHAMIDRLMPMFQAFQHNPAGDGDQRGGQGHGPHGPDNSEFSQEFDRLGQNDRQNADQQAAPDDTQAQAGRMRRQRMSRTGIYTGANG